MPILCLRSVASAQTGSTCHFCWYLQEISPRKQLAQLRQIVPLRLARKMPFVHIERHGLRCLHVPVQHGPPFDQCGSRTAGTVRRRLYIAGSRYHVPYCMSGPVARPCFRLIAVLTALRLPAAQDALTFATQMRAVGPAWVEALESWNCPTPANSSNSSCDPCGVNSW